MSQDFFSHPACQQRLCCPDCRTSQPFRQTIFDAGKVSEVDFACPYGFTADNLPTPVAAMPKATPGPGTQLKRILAGWGITETEDCQCRALAALMNTWGPDGCEARSGEIIKALVGKAEKRGWLRLLPFKEFWAEELLKMAVERAREAAVK